MKKFLLFTVIFFGGFQISQAQQLLWERFFNYGPGADVFIPLTKVNDTTVIAGGANANYYESFYVQYHINGTKNWHKYSRFFITGEQDIQPFGKGYFYTGAVPNYTTTQGGSIMLQRLSPLGDTLWTKVYTAFNNDNAYRMQVSGNNIYIAGIGRNLNTNTYILQKTDTAGVLMWRRFYRPVAGAAYACDIVVRPNGNLIISGVSQSGNPYMRLHLLEVNANGDSLRSKLISISNSSGITNEQHYRGYNNFKLTSDGNYICSGTIDSASYKFGYVAKIDTSLNLVWSKVIRPIFPQKRIQTSSVQELANGNFAVITNNESPATNSFLVHTLGSSGQLLSQVTYPSTLCNSIRIMDWELLSDGTGIAAGRCFTNNEAYITRFGGIPTGIPEEANAGNSLGQSYPNPATQETIIPYNLPKNFREANIVIREIATGKEIRKYELESREGNLTVDLREFRNGLYLYSLKVDDKPVATKKLAVMK